MPKRSTRQSTGQAAIICPQCGATFFEWLSQRPVYCSKPCKDAATRRSNEERFWSYVVRTASCWLWTGHKSGSGHGIFTIFPQRRGTTAHHYAWELLIGPVPAGHEVCHDCPEGDNPACVNPAHLFLCTDAEHGRDKALKMQMRRGAEHGRAKLTDEAIHIIRSAPKRRGVCLELASHFGVSVNTIYGIRCGKTWTHIPADQ